MRQKFTFSFTNQVYVFFHHAEILQKPDRPLPCPYLPTYLPTYLWETKKEITGRVKVGYHTN